MKFHLFTHLQLVWVLYIDLICLDYGGNLIDACVLALTAALKNSECSEATLVTFTNLIFKTEIENALNVSCEFLLPLVLHKYWLCIFWFIARNSLLHFQQLPCLAYLLRRRRRRLMLTSPNTTCFSLHVPLYLHHLQSLISELTVCFLLF